MISVNKLHYWFIQGADHSDSKYLQALSAAQRDIYLNAAKDNIIEFYADLVETNDTVRQYLKDITVRDVVLKGKDEGEKYIVPFPENMLKPIKQYAWALKEGCSTPQKWLIRRMPSDKIDRALKNSHTRRASDFEETFGLESERGFEVYHLDGKIQSVVLDYVRRVENVQGPQFENAEQYINEEGDPISQNVNLDINNVTLARKIADLAVLFGLRDRGHVNDFNAKYQTILSIDRVFTS